MSFALHVVVLQMLWIFILVSIREIFLAGLGIPDQRVDYFLFPLPIPMFHDTSHVHTHTHTRTISRRSLQYVSDVYDGLCFNKRGSLRVWTLREVLTVRVATYPPLEKTAIHVRLIPHTCSHALPGCCGELSRSTKILTTM